MRKRFSLFLLVSILFTGLIAIYSCGGGGGGSSGGGITLASVTPLYSGSGADWNDYVKNDGLTIFEATDTAATGTETGGYEALIHGGEMRAVAVTGKSSCTGLTASDSRNAFAWRCDGNTDPVRMISTELADGKYLSDLIDFASGSWRNISVTVRENGTVYGTAPASAWWGNPIVVDNDGGVLATVGNIYIVKSSALTNRYEINNDKIALVVQPGVTMQGPQLGDSIIITNSRRRFIWFEGKIDASGDSEGIGWNTDFSVLRGVEVYNADTGSSPRGITLSVSSSSRYENIYIHDIAGDGIYANILSDSRISDLVLKDNTLAGLFLNWSQDNSISNISAYSNSFHGVYLQGSDDNELENIEAYGNGDAGVLLSESLRNTVKVVKSANNIGNGVEASFSANSNALSQIIASNNNRGVVVDDSVDNTFSDITVFNNQFDGFYLSTATNSFVSNVTATNNGYAGLYLLNSSNNTLANLSAVNNATAGVDINQSTNNVFYNIESSNNVTYGIYLRNSANSNVFAGLLKVGSNGGNDCETAPPGSTQGLVTITCTDTGAYGSSAYTGHASSAVLYRPVNSNSSFVGKASGDTTNVSDSNGAAQYDLITAWTSFDNAYRGWGRDGNAFADTSNQGWVGAGETARIWDWSLAATGDVGDAGGPVLLEALTFPNPQWNTLPFIWFSGSTTDYLVNTVEVMGDDIGNDNLLCESGETCLTTYNMGSYQGHGSVIDNGVFNAGAVTNVSLVRYDTNGM